MKFVITVVLSVISICVLAQTNSVTWNSVVAAPISVACADGEAITINFSIANTDVVDVEVDLGIGMEYEANSINIVSGATLVSTNSSNLNQPIFQINASAGASIIMTFNRTANCAARIGQLNGNTFEDEVKITKNGTQIGTTQKTNAYQINYAALSITNQSTTPTISNVGGTVTRSVTIANGSFGYLSNFTFKDTFPTGTLDITNVQITDGTNTFAINSANIMKTVTDLTVQIDGSIIANIGDNDNQFELNEDITLEYTISVLDCHQGGGTPSILSAAWGCGSSTCQASSVPAAINISNAVPSLSLTSLSQPNIDLCKPVTYSTRFKNNSTDAKDFARDVAVILGLRANTSPIARPTNNTMWSGHHAGVKIFSNFKLNGISVTLPTLNNLGPVDYVAYDYFTTDPDGVGGLDDIDGDGYYDDLGPGQYVDISFDVTIYPRNSSCGDTQLDYVVWEHISADASWHNQCGTPMQPVRDEFNYANFIRNYLNPTPVTATPNIFDGQPFTVSIKPHLYTGINCNGESASTGSGVDFRVALVLPPGVSLSPTATTDAHFASYNPTIYQSNDTVYYSINRVNYNWFNFELVMDCALWTGTTQYASFDFVTRYTCSDGVNVCFQKDMHCKTVVSLPHCGGNCKGFTTQSFTAERINPGWTDVYKTAFATNYAKGHVQPYDTVHVQSLGVLHDTTVDNAVHRMTYTTTSSNSIFLFQSGTITIYDADASSGQSAHTFTISTPPTFTYLGSNKYEMSTDLTAYTNLISPTYQFEDDDSIAISYYLTINPTVPTISLNKITDFLSYFTFDKNGTEHTCTQYAATMTYGRANFSYGSSVYNHSNCGGIAYHHWTNSTYISGIYTNEYRPHYYIDSFTFDLPLGMNFVSIYRLRNGQPTYLYNVPAIVSGNHITVPRPSNYQDPNNSSLYYPSIALEYLADCRLPSGTITIPNPVYAKEFAYLADTSKHLPANRTGNIIIRYTPPDFTINVGEQKKITPTNDVEWEIQVCNTTANANIAYNWVLIDDLGGQVNVTNAFDAVTGTPLTLVNNGNGQIMAQFDALNANTCTTVRIVATYTGCTPDTIGVTHGWSCFAYPAANELFACGTQYEFEVVPQTAQLSMSVTPLANTPNNPANGSSTVFGQSTVDMCAPFPVEVVLTSAQLGYLYDVSAIMNNPIGGGASGLEFVNGSGYIEYPEGSTPRPFNAIANSALVAASTNPTMPFLLSQIDPTNFNGLPFKGVGTPDSNKVILRFNLQPTCDLNSGDVLSFESGATVACGDPALGSGELISAYNLRITGVTTPYTASITTLTLPDMYNCSQTSTLNLALTKVGAVAVGTNDKLVIVLPPDVTYNSLIGCSSAICVDPAQLTITNIGNKQVLNFKMPAMNNGDNLALALSVTYSTTTHGCSENADFVTAQVVTSTTVFCAATGSNCPDFGATVGQKTTTVNFYKPDISLSNVEIMDVSYGATPQLYNYEITIANTSTLNSVAPIIIDIYCANNQGNPTGSILHSITTTGNLIAGQSTTFQGSFSNTCNAANGVVVQVTKQASNGSHQCICDEEIIHTTRKPLGSISGEVFFDMNLNGANDNENAGGLAQNILIHLLDNNDNPILDVLGDTLRYTLGLNGLFSFTHLPQGIYQIVLDQSTTPNGYEGGSPNQRVIAIGLGQNAVNQDLAIRTCQLSVSGVTSQNPNCADFNSGQIVITASSSSTLFYSITNEPFYQPNNTFSNLGVGLYTIRIQNEAGCEATYPDFIQFDIATCIENCTNGEDDDGDGLVDCDDPDCEGVGTINQIEEN